MLIVLAAAAALFASGAAEPDPPARYALELSIVRGGVTTISTRSVIVEDGNANLSIIDSERSFEMNANLNLVQGDGGQLALSVNIIDGDVGPWDPSLVFDRGSTGRIEIGNEGPTGEMIDGLTLTVSPLPATTSVTPTPMPWPAPRSLSVTRVR